MPRPRIPFLLLAPLLTACAEPGTSHQSAATISQVADTTFVNSPGDGVDGPVRLVELLRLNADSLDVGSFDAAVFGPGGTIWIYDQRGRGGETVLVLDSLGNRLAQAGHSGEGPGEYRGAARLFRASDGSVLLRVVHTTRVVRFGPGGEVLATMTLPPAAANGWLVTPDTAGGWYQAAAFEENTAARVGRFGWIHFSPEGAIRDTAFPPRRFFEEPTPLGIAPGRVRTVTRTGEVITALPGPSRVDRIGRDGRVTAMTWRAEPPPYLPEERRDIQDVSDRLNALVGRGPHPLPERKAPVHLLLTTTDGGIWAALAGEGVRIPDNELPKERDVIPPMRWKERERWGAFDRDGVLHFVVVMPGDATVLDRDGDRLVGAMTSAAGLPVLIVWRITRDGTR